MRKINKELLLKHHFWILLGVFVPLVFSVLFLLWSNVAGDIEDKSKKVAQTKAEVGKLARTDIKNQAWIDALKEKEENLAKQKNKVWEQVWQGQSALMSWPRSLLEAYPALKNLDFGEPLKDNDLRDQFTAATGYKQQLADAIAIVQPILTAEEIKQMAPLKAVCRPGEGVVQFKNGWAKVLRHVHNWIDDKSAKTVPGSEEVWLALEDLWVQRELLHAVKEANEFASIFTKVPGAPKADAARGEIDHQIFVSPRWKLELLMTQKEIRWRISNNGARLQTLGLKFLVKLQPDKQIDLFVDGEPLAPNQSSDWGVKEFNAVGFKGLEGVEQQLDWRSAPVKRIDKLALGYHSHRTASRGLLSAPCFEEKKDAAPAGIPGVQLPPGTSLPPGVQLPPGMPLPGGRPGGAPKGPVASSGDSKNELGLEKNRYVEVTQQVRRMPLGLVLIVDQAHVQDVLTALSNSVLRIEITQAQWKRYRDPIKPPVEEKRKDDKPPVGAPPMGVLPKGPLPKGFPGAPPGLPSGAPKSAAAAEEDTANLVELAVYGIASLYQRYPPRQPAAENKDTPVVQPGKTAPTLPR